METETAAVTDIYLAALAIQRGLHLRRTQVDARGYVTFEFAAEPMREVFADWTAKETPTDLRTYLAALRFIRAVTRSTLRRKRQGAV